MNLIFNGVTINIVDYITQYGIAGVALYLMYKIYNEKLTLIVQKLDEIKEALK